MKQLSIEEKARRYDEAIINGSRLWECDKITREDYEFIFPALEESEDERIIGNIIATIHLYYGEPLEDEAKEMIAWLEKQGKNDMGISEATKQKLKDNLNKALEKETPESWNKFLDEQKSADKVEPKFMVGDLVVIDGEVLHVKEVTEDGYLTDEGGLIPFRNEKEAHIWTIQDAKDGDVLAVEEIEEKYQYPFVAIYKERGLDFFNSYCSIGFDGKFYEGNTGHSTKKIHPATKEQRNLLFQKMKEAGYEWNAEKKELKKIKQKPTEDVDLPEFESYLCLMFQKFRTKGMCTNGEIIDYVKEYSQKLRDILVKPAWSEEDEDILNTIINHFKVDIECTDEDDTVRWLKSLKERCTWKPSEGHLKALEDAMNKYHGSYSATLCQLYGELEKLKK